MDEFRIHGKLVMDAEVSDRPLALPAPDGFQNADAFNSFTDAQNSSSESLKDNTALMKEFGNIMPEIIKNLRMMNDVVSRTNQNLPALRNTSLVESQRRISSGSGGQNFLQIINTGDNMLQSAVHGNVTGSFISGVSGASSLATNFSKQAGSSGMNGLAKGLLLGGGALAVGAAVLKGGKALADAYEDAMPTIFGTGKAFGVTDNSGAMGLYRTVNAYNSGTGLDIQSYNSIVQGLRRQGVGNGLADANSQAIAASQLAQTTSRWAYATGGDVNQYANLAGLMARYGSGKSNVSSDFNYLVSAGKASGLNDSQIPEFLSGIEKVMEDGIAKGFSRSSTEVADTLLMFSKMSGGNAFWQGEQGAKMLNQMNAGISNATNLQKTEDILVYQAFASVYNNEDKVKAALEKGGGQYIAGANYSNMMQLIEQGVNGENFGAIMDMFDNSYTNTDDRIEALKSAFGLNTSGAMKLMALDRNASDTAIKNIINTPENQNNETKWQKDLNIIAEALQGAGEKVFGLELKGIDAISTSVKNIENWLIKPKKDYSTNTKEQADYQASSKTNGRKDDPEFRKNLLNWNGLGFVEGETFNQFGSNVLETNNGKTGYRLYGQVKENDIAKYTNTYYGDILQGEDFFGDDASSVLAFTAWLQNAKQAKDYRNRISSRKGETHDQWLELSEKENTKEMLLALKGIYDKLNNMSITENKRP